MNIRIFRQPTMCVQPDGSFYIDTLQTQDTGLYKCSGIDGKQTVESVDCEWEDVEIVEADSY